MTPAKEYIADTYVVQHIHTTTHKANLLDTLPALHKTMNIEKGASGIDRTFMMRRAYKGGEVRRGYKVTGITCMPSDEGEMPREVAHVDNMDEYSSGCKLHRSGCFGHMCVTPTGSLLPPHSLSFRAGDIRTQYYTACGWAFRKDEGKYVEELKKTNYGKSGHLRSIMATPVSGSARLVAVPHDSDDYTVLFTSRNLAEKILFCLPERDSDGREGSRYVERHLVEGDYVMLERPPSLTKFNNQPFRIMFWDRECLGVHPTVFSHFHGDYDGDEVQLYALGTVAAINEAKEWRHPVHEAFTTARSIMLDNLPEDYSGTDSEGDMEFIKYSTIGFNQINDGITSSPLGNYVRSKDEHLGMFRDRLRDRPGTSTFLKDAREGVKSIMMQQLGQGIIGDMSRVSRISLMCFCRGRNGGTYVVGRRTRMLLDPSTTPSTGSPSVRCVMLLCQVAQQTALDSHRVGSKTLTAVDLVASLLRGRSVTGSRTPCNTLYIMRDMSVDQVKEEMSTTWAHLTEGFVITIALDTALRNDRVHNLVGAYSPVVLSRCAVEERRTICRAAVNVVFSYHGLVPEVDDLEDLVIAMTYRVEDSSLPITTREGMLARKLGWTETLMACDYTKMPTLKGSTSAVWSATSATMCSNFDLLP